MKSVFDETTRGPLAARRAAVMEALGRCPHCGGPRRLVHIAGDDRPIESCDRCRLSWLSGPHVGRRVCRWASELPRAS